MHAMGSSLMALRSVEYTTGAYDEIACMMVSLAAWAAQSVYMGVVQIRPLTI
jgi:hypothetical protein